MMSMRILSELMEEGGGRRYGLDDVSLLWVWGLLFLLVFVYGV